MKKILEVSDLQVSFKTDEGLLKAVNGVSFDLYEGETLGIVGESGSGKTVTGMSIIRILSGGRGILTDGSVIFEDKNLLRLSEKELQKIRGKKIAMIFQDPMTSLNPFLRVSTQVSEILLYHTDISKKEAQNKAVELLKLVGIPNAERRVNDYPHQFSGGMRQRLVIAMAISCNPNVIIADEPTTALDVTIQAQILDILQNLKEEFNTSIILITHDLGVVAGVCDRTHVMYAGRILEKADTSVIFSNPQHPYTRGLLQALPRADKSDKSPLQSIPGTPPNLVNLPNCCPFFPRCDEAREECQTAFPSLTTISKDHQTWCWARQGDRS